MEEWMKPAVVVAVSAVVVQGVKSLWDLIFAAIGVKENERMKRIALCNALLMAIDSAPGSDGQKVAAKRTVLKKYLSEDDLAAIGDLMD